MQSSIFVYMILYALESVLMHTIITLVSIVNTTSIEIRYWLMTCSCSKSLPNKSVVVSGGETIKQINQQTGAHCELDRRPPSNPAEKTFVIRGSPDQIESAKRLIAEKLGMVSTLNTIFNLPK